MAQDDDQDSLIIGETVGRYTRLICDALNRLEIDDVRKLIVEIETRLEGAIASDVSPTRRLAADVLRRARRLPVGPDRNDLRQTAIGLLWLDRRGYAARAIRRVGNTME